MPRRTTREREGSRALDAPGGAHRRPVGAPDRERRDARPRRRGEPGRLELGVSPSVGARGAERGPLRSRVGRSLVDGMIRNPGCGLHDGERGPEGSCERASASRRGGRVVLARPDRGDGRSVPDLRRVSRMRAACQVERELHLRIDPTQSRATCRSRASTGAKPTRSVEPWASGCRGKPSGSSPPRASGGERYPWGGGGRGCFFAATLVGDATGQTCTKGPSPVGGATRRG